MEYYALEPFGAERDNLHAALIASTIANVHRGKNQKAFKAEDFMLSSKRPKSKDESTKAFIDFLFANSVEK